MNEIGHLVESQNFNVSAKFSSKFSNRMITKMSSYKKEQSFNKRETMSSRHALWFKNQARKNDEKLSAYKSIDKSFVCDKN